MMNDVMLKVNVEATAMMRVNVEVTATIANVEEFYGMRMTKKY